VATLAALRDRVRLELGDLVTGTETSAIGDGTIRRFEMPDKPVDPGTLSVSISDETTTTALLEDDYELDAQGGVLLLPQPLADGDTLFVSGSSYRYFSDADLDVFLRTALMQHVHGRDDIFGAPVIVDGLPPVEEYPVALLALIEALWALATDAAFDISISTPEGVSIPRSERWRQLMQMVQSRQAQYLDICQQLNVGLYRIEMFELRRISRTTGRFVPIYRPREIEDNRPPQRIFPPIDRLGAEPAAVPVVTRTDLVSIARKHFELNLTGLGDLTGKTPYAFVRGYPNQYGYLSQFHVEINDAATGDVTLLLTPEQTFYLRPKAFWDLQLRDTTNESTLIRQGEFTTVRQGSTP
jgi:hypothetical protein